MPFKGTGKEYIGDDITEISSAVKVHSSFPYELYGHLISFLLQLQSALKQCCLQLKSKIVKKLQARERQDRKRNLNRYIPGIARAIMETVGEIADESPPQEAAI